MHVILRPTSQFGSNGDVGGNLELLFATVNYNAAELCVVANVEVQGGMHRNKQPNVAIQRDLQTREGQHVTTVSERNSRPNLETDGWCRGKVRLCLADTRNLSVGLEIDERDRYKKLYKKRTRGEEQNVQVSRCAIFSSNLANAVSFANLPVYQWM